MQKNGDGRRPELGLDLVELRVSLIFLDEIFRFSSGRRSLTVTGVGGLHW